MPFLLTAHLAAAPVYCALVLFSPSARQRCVYSISPAGSTWRDDLRITLTALRTAARVPGGVGLRFFCLKRHAENDMQHYDARLISYRL
jgi:hypothetical protein